VKSSGREIAIVGRGVARGGRGPNKGERLADRGSRGDKSRADSSSTRTHEHMLVLHNIQASPISL
jgi:hypothetical protein